MLNFCDFIQVYVFSTNHHLKAFILTAAVVIHLGVKQALF